MKHTIITPTTPGVLPLEGDLVGKVVIQNADDLRKRFRVAKLQLVTATSGFGCSPTALGRKVFGDPLWIRAGTKLRRNSPPDENEGCTYYRNDFIGIATPELIERVSQEPDEIEPGDPFKRVVIVAKAGSYYKGATVRECLKKLGIRSLKGAAIAVVQEEAWVDDFGALRTPTEVTHPGIPNVQWLCEGEANITLDVAEARAAELIAKAAAMKEGATA